MHLSADYARDSRTITCVHAGSRQHIPCNRAVHPLIRSRRLDSVQTTGEKAACLHDATSAFDYMDKVTNKWQTRKYSHEQGCHLWKIFLSKRISGGLEPHEDVTRDYQSIVSPLNCLLVIEREGALVSGSRIPSRET